MRFFAARLGFALALALGHGPARAEEGGAGHYTPGISGTLTDLAPSAPGLVVQPLLLHFDGEVGASRIIPIAGQVTAGLEARADVATLGTIYTLEQRILGAFYSVGAYAPVMNMEVTATIATPIGQIQRTDAVTGLGDVTLVPALFAWKEGPFQFGASLPVYAPTGSYEVGRLANPGKNYWTVDPTLSVSYTGATTGFNAALFAGVTFNTENQDTDYQSGSMLHLEASVQQLLPVGPGFLGIGANAFLLEQVEGDSGPGATLGSLRGRSIGIGPAVDYVLPLDNATAVLEFRWLPEIETRNRVKGDFFWLKGVVQF